MNTDVAWQLWGMQDPYFGVLTNPKYRSDVLTTSAKEEFFEIGRQHVDQVMHTVRHHFDPAFTPKRVLDFGCGVGRLVIPFAVQAEDVVGMDIAPSMLDEARRNCAERQLQDVTLVMSDDTLSNASGQFDMVHSCLVLQHLETVRGRRLFEMLTGKIRPGGFGVLHVTFGWTHHAGTFGQAPPPVVTPPPSAWAVAKRSVRQLRMRSSEEPESDDTERGDPEMQMNYYSVSELYFILMQFGVRKVFSEMTDHGGALGALMFFQVPGPP